MRRCKRCTKIKPWFMMFSDFNGMAVVEYEVCKHCANELKVFGVRAYLKGDL